MNQNHILPYQKQHWLEQRQWKVPDQPASPSYQQPLEQCEEWRSVHSQQLGQQQSCWAIGEQPLGPLWGFWAGHWHWVFWGYAVGDEVLAWQLEVCQGGCCGDLWPVWVLGPMVSSVDQKQMGWMAVRFNWLLLASHSNIHKMFSYQVIN